MHCGMDFELLSFLAVAFYEITRIFFVSWIWLKGIQIAEWLISMKDLI